jgi:probable HAF family extracellular repeat protein
LLFLLCSSSPAAEFSFTPLGGLPGGNFDSIPFAISADGTVVVGSAESSFGSRAFRWTREGGMVALGDLPGGQEYSVGGSGKSVSADGNTIVGYSGSSNAQAEAFRWTQAGGMVGLGALVPGGYRSIAWGVSGDGSTVVGYGETESTSTQAFRWSAADGMVPLSGVTNNSIAFAASHDGSVVVGRNQSSISLDHRRRSSRIGHLARYYFIGGERDDTRWVNNYRDQHE